MLTSLGFCHAGAVTKDLPSSVRILPYFHSFTQETQEQKQITVMPAEEATSSSMLRQGLLLKQTNCLYRGYWEGISKIFCHLIYFVEFNTLWYFLWQSGCHVTYDVINCLFQNWPMGKKGNETTFAVLVFYWCALYKTALIASPPHMNKGIIWKTGHVTSCLCLYLLKQERWASDDNGFVETSFIEY